MFTSCERTTDGDAIMMGVPGAGNITDYHDPLEDVFGSEPGSPVIEQVALQQQARSNVLEISDVPRLRSVHVTNGYREGISAGKERSLQAGFDEGYALGAEYGHLVGRIRGVLEALLSISAGRTSDQHDKVKQLSVEAQEELSLHNIFHQMYFGEDGIWTYDVSGTDDSITFRQVAAAHPLLLKWTQIVHKTAAGFKVTVHLMNPR